MTTTTDHAAGVIAGLESEIGKVIVGQRVLIRRLLTGLFAAIPFASSRGQARAGCGRATASFSPRVSPPRSPRSIRKVT